MDIPEWKRGDSYTLGQGVTHQGKLYKAIISMGWSFINPEDSVLWVECERWQIDYTAENLSYAGI